MGHDLANYDDDEISETVLVPQKVAETISKDGVLRSMAEEEETVESLFVSKKTLLAIVERLGGDEDVTPELLQELVRPQFPQDEALVRVDLRTGGLDYDSVEDMLEEFGPRGTAMALINAFECIGLAADDSEAIIQIRCKGARQQQQKEREALQRQMESVGAVFTERVQDDQLSQWNEIVEDDLPINTLTSERLYNSQLSELNGEPLNASRQLRKGEDKTAVVRCGACPGTPTQGCKFP